MKEIRQLIQKMSSGNLTAYKAAEELLSMGVTAVPYIIEAIKRNTGPEWLLQNIILQIRDPDVIPILIEILESDNITLRITAFKALGYSNSERALQPLLTALSSKRKNLAVEALGELGNINAIPELQELTQNILHRPGVFSAIEGQYSLLPNQFDRDDLRLLVDVAIALSKLHNFEVASLVLPLTQYYFENDSMAFLIRKEVVRMLQYAIIPGMFPALQESLQDTDTEVCITAIDALFYLGTKESIESLVYFTNDESYNIFNHTIVRLYDLTGQQLQSDASDHVKEWWKRNSVEYISGICYRLGEPMFLPNLISLLADPAQASRVLQELKIVTSNDFGFIPDSFLIQVRPDKLMESAQKWWLAEGHKFETGKLYKWGQRQNVSRAL